MVNPIVAAVPTAIETIDDIYQVVSSKDPLLVRTVNYTSAMPVKFGVVRDLNAITVNTLPCPVIRPGDIVDATFGASSWSDASMTMEYWFDYMGHIFNVHVHYAWISTDDAHFNIKIFKSKTAKSPLEVIAEGGSHIYRTLTVNAEGFEIHINTSGKCVHVVFTGGT
ncbi:MAG: hypothetical protein P8179_16430 [Candidatus Thiodiazotropha sp.]|jgi:hypothetical protein